MHDVKDLKIISRADAKALGLTRYNTGKPCKHGHIAERLVSTRNCCACNGERKGTTERRAREGARLDALIAKGLNPISRAGARTSGLKRFFSGMPCPHGHVAERLVSNGTCCTCVEDKQGTTERKKLKSEAIDALIAHGVKTTSREDAGVLGLKRFFTGVQCEQGHVAERYASNGNCVECVAADSKAHYAFNPEKHIEAAKARYKANPERAIGHVKKWRESNPDKVAANNAARRASKLDATVLLTPEEEARVDAIYAEAERNGWHVDHIKALAKGGLHHPDNLVAIPPVMNMQKGAQYWPDLHALQ